MPVLLILFLLVLGGVAGYLLARYVVFKEQGGTGGLGSTVAWSGPAAEKPADAGDAADEDLVGTPPPRIERPQGEPDDLKQIRGIGPGIEGTLNDLGIWHFHQIAALTPEQTAWVNSHLKFKGRIEREEWISQAKDLAEGKQYAGDGA
jgi:predicted flap endonuclease-1-like 5' DNA nuclease